MKIISAETKHITLENSDETKELLAFRSFIKKIKANQSNNGTPILLSDEERKLLEELQTV